MNDSDFLPLIPEDSAANSPLCRYLAASILEILLRAGGICPWPEILEQVRQQCGDLLPSDQRAGKDEIIRARLRLEAGWQIERVPGSNPMVLRRLTGDRIPDSVATFFPLWPAF